MNKLIKGILTNKSTRSGSALKKLAAVSMNAGGPWAP